MEPLAFAVLAGLTPAEIRCELVDERIEPLSFDRQTDLVALSVDTFTARRAYQIAAEFRRRNVPVVMGGCHPTLIPDEALQHADAVVIGDAEDTWPKLLADVRTGRLKPVYKSTFPTLESVPHGRQVFAGKRYGPVALVQFGRGCRFACDFCSVRAFYGRSIRYRPVQDVADELQDLRSRHIFFTDDNLFADPSQAQNLLQRIRPLRLRWSCQTSLDTATKPSIVRTMADTGCTSVTVGVESLEPENLKQMNKAWNLDLGRVEQLLQVFRDHGIMVYATFVFGYDHDTPDVFKRTLQFAIESKFFLANFNPLTPTPGTPLFERLRREGRLIKHPWWLHPEYRYGESTFHPRGMTADELTAGCFQARREFNTSRSILRRGLDRKANLRSLYNAWIYGLSNLISRHEIHHKQHRRLGATGTALATGNSL